MIKQRLRADKCELVIVKSMSHTISNGGSQIDNRYSLGVKLYGVYPYHVNVFVAVNQIFAALSTKKSDHNNNSRFFIAAYIRQAYLLYSG